jgi:hypothetical protein
MQIRGKRIIVTVLSRQGILLLIFALNCLFTVSCSSPPPEAPDDYVLKSAVITFTDKDFSDALDLKRSAYPYEIKDDTEAYNRMVAHLVKTLTDEIVLLSAAQHFGIGVTDEEFKAAVDRFKKDYPEDSFEQILLENAVSYPFWLKRFKEGMIIEKLIDQELRSKIRITSDEITTFYRQLGKEQEGQNTDDSTRAAVTEKELVKKLKMHKTQEQYEKWMNALTLRHPVQINDEKLKKFMIDNQQVKEDDE